MTPENKQMVEEWAESGWYPAISAAAERLTNLCPQIEFDQIKEKFGQLRFYYTIPLDLDAGGMPVYARGSREKVEQYAEEIVIWASGWVDGYESRRQQVADLRKALEEMTKDRDLILDAKMRGEISAERREREAYETGRETVRTEMLEDLEWPSDQD